LDVDFDVVWEVAPLDLQPLIDGLNQVVAAKMQA
jgi:hypothetical protein